MLVPAFMRLAGDANWWAPRWLRRVHDRIGISEHVDLDDDEERWGEMDEAERRRPASATPVWRQDRVVTPAGPPRARRGEGDRLRDEILAAAEELLIETADESAVSIRAIADRVGVTPPSIYRHFADKDALIIAVCESVFGRLDDALETAARDATDPLDEIMRKGRAYVGFGLDPSRALPAAVHVQGRPPRRTSTWTARPSPGATAFDHLQDTVAQPRLRRPGVALPDPFAMTCAIWTGVHGITSLRIALPYFPWPPIDEQLALVVDPWRAALCPVDRRPASETSARAVPSGLAGRPR